jgi:uncharacterized membrane protein YdbT with pleckstrin-like domain
MSPSAEQAGDPMAVSLVPERVLEDGEIVILAVKPSGWLLLLASVPVWSVAAAIAVLAWLLRARLRGGLDASTIVALCVVAGAVRLVVAVLQWYARLYVLTDRRVLRLRGVLREELWQCPLKKVLRVHLVAAAGERLTGTGSLVFETEGRCAADSAWACLSRAAEVRRMVEEARGAAR